MYAFWVQRLMDTSVRLPVRWGAERRLRFIDFRLYWEGRINRSDLTSFFGISVPQASLDLARYLEIAPDNAIYDKSDKAYRALQTFAPRFSSGESDAYLNELLALALGINQTTDSFIGRVPEFGAVETPGRRIDPAKLQRVLTAIRERLRLTIQYQSINHESAAERDISPHALGFDGFRWHIRAYCHTREQFRDFVFARILDMGAQSPSEVDGAQDAQWQRIVIVRIGPNAKLGDARRKVIELDYGMRNGEGSIAVRAALAFYLLQHLGVLREDSSLPPESQHIVLLNRDELLDVMPALTKGRD
jgi:hypothetical protein